MLSILIPCYNNDVYPLAEEIQKQSTLCNIAFEIIIIDDCSSNLLYNVDKINNLPHTQIIRNKENQGRSPTRNLLAQKAKFENLLFVDAGTFPKSKNFILNYVSHLSKPVIIGGMAQEAIPPKKPYKFRWLYTKKREACCNDSEVIREIYTSANFLIKKHIFTSFPFEESIKTYGFEDYVFFKKLNMNGINFKYINNPVVHDSKEHAKTFLKKTEEGLKNLVELKKDNSVLIADVKIVKWQSRISNLGLNSLVAALYRLVKPVLEKNFCSDNPSIFLFDFYKLGCLSSIISKK